MGQGLHTFASGLALAVVALSSAPALAVQPAPLVTPAGQVELARLVDLAAQRLSLNIEYDASALRGSATLRLDAGLSDAELWTLTNRVLASRGFTTVRAPGDAAYSVVRLADAAAAAPITRPAAPHEVPHEYPRPGYTSVLLETRHRPARELAEPLARILSRPAGAASAVGDREVRPRLNRKSSSCSISREIAPSCSISGPEHAHIHAWTANRA